MKVFSEVFIKMSLGRFQQPGGMELINCSFLLAENTIESLRGLYPLGLLK